ncbi:MAG: hypothetical protein GY810_26890 [Aureispira sp.]|nr:hypothetical protein [Aureispira sp.]
MQKYYLMLFVVVPSLFLWSCENSTKTGKEDKVKEALSEFYEVLKTDEYGDTEKFLDEILTESVTRDEWIGLLKTMEKYGTIESFSPMSIKMGKTNEFTVATARYEVKRKEQSLYDEIELIEREDGFKIASYYYATSKDMLGIGDDAKAVAKEFYKDCKAKDYKKVAELMSERLLSNVSEEQLIAFLEKKEKYGELVDFENTGSDAKEKNGGIECVLDYTVKHENQTLYEDLILFKKDGKFYIEEYEYFTNREKRHAHEDEGNNSDEAAEAFFAALEHQDPTELELLLDKEAPAAEKWSKLMGDKEAVTGALKKHFLLDSYHKSKDGEDYYILDYHTEYENKHLYERLILIKREEGYKVIDYSYNENKDEIFE